MPKGANLRNEGPDEEEEGASYSFESTPYAGGRIEANGTGLTVRKFVTDHLGSVRAIVTNNTVVERSDYYPFGGKHDNSTLPTLTSNRYGFSGKERQNLFSSTDPYLDFGARFYDPITTRWLSPDPMADKYTNFTQYNYCGADPMNFVDPDGKVVETIWDIINVGIDIKSGIDNIKQGNYLAAATDAGALLLDVAAVLLPAIPGGAGTAVKAARGADKVVDAAKSVDGANSIGKTVTKRILPNGGISKPHGGKKHNNTIDNIIQSRSKDNTVSNIRKNQKQVNIDGVTVGNNRPDIQYDKKGIHYNIEVDNHISNNVRHESVIKQNDPKAVFQSVIIK